MRLLLVRRSPAQQRVDDQRVLDVHEHAHGGVHARQRLDRQHRVEERGARAAEALGNLHAHDAEVEQPGQQARVEAGLLVHGPDERPDLLRGEVEDGVVEEPFVLGKRRKSGRGSGLRAHDRNAIIAKKDGWHAQIAARAPRTMAPARRRGRLSHGACARRCAPGGPAARRTAAGAAGSARSPGTARAQQGAPPAPAGQAPAGEPVAPVIPGQDAPAIFRGGINFVRVDVIATDGKGQHVTDLKQEDFDVFEDNQPQSVEQFRLIKVDGNPKPGDPPPRVIRNRDDEETEAARDDVRIFAILLDDYHVRRSNSVSVREPLTRFIQTQLRPNDMIAVMYPLTPVFDVSFTRDHDSIIRVINQFEGRKYDYRPKNQIEENYVRYPTETVEKIRNDVVMGALRGLSVRLGSLREGRKSVIFVSEGFTAILPPQMRRQDASQPENPIQARAAGGLQDSSIEETAAWFGQSDVNSRMRDVYQMANRNNTSIYSLDPRGLAVFEFGLDDSAATPTFATDRRVLQMTQDTLRSLSEETDGRAIVNRNTLYEGLTQMVRDSSFYYLLGYSSKAPTDGKFHEIKVRIKRRGVEARARRGYWAATAADMLRAATPAKEVSKPVLSALADAVELDSVEELRPHLGGHRARHRPARRR